MSRSIRRLQIERSVVSFLCKESESGLSDRFGAVADTATTVQWGTSALAVQPAAKVATLTPDVCAEGFQTTARENMFESISRPLLKSAMYVTSTSRVAPLSSLSKWHSSMQRTRMLSAILEDWCQDLVRLSNFSGVLTITVSNISISRSWGPARLVLYALVALRAGDQPRPSVSPVISTLFA